MASATAGGEGEGRGRNTLGIKTTGEGRLRRCSPPPMRTVGACQATAYQLYTPPHFPTTAFHNTFQTCRSAASR